MKLIYDRDKTKIYRETRTTRGPWLGENINFIDVKTGHMLGTFNTLSDDYALTNASNFRASLKAQGYIEEGEYNKK